MLFQVVLKLKFFPPEILYTLSVTQFGPFESSIFKYNKQ